MNAGDYICEPSGVLHDATTPLEYTIYTFICDGSVAYSDGNNFTGCTDWKTIAKSRDRAAIATAAA